MSWHDHNGISVALLRDVFRVRHGPCRIVVTRDQWWEAVLLARFAAPTSLVCCFDARGCGALGHLAFTKKRELWRSSMISTQSCCSYSR